MRATARRPSRCSPTPFAERAARARPERRGDARVPPALARAATRRSSSRELASALRARPRARLLRPRAPPRRARVLRDGRELRAYGSQGEQRLALLALLLAERECSPRSAARMPLMLLDDVMSELDAERRELLVERARAGRPERDRDHRPRARARARDAAGRRACGSSPGAVLQEALAA